MGLFDKGVDVIDYTLLKKRGLLNVKEIEPMGVKCDREGFVDLGSVNQNALPNSETTDSATAATSSEQSSPTFSNFFGDMGAVASATTASAPSVISETSPDIGSVKVKVEDLEFKLDRLIDRLSAMEDKLREFENKAIAD